MARSGGVGGEGQNGAGVGAAGLGRRPRGLRFCCWTAGLGREGRRPPGLCAQVASREAGTVVSGSTSAARGGAGGGRRRWTRPGRKTPALVGRPRPALEGRRPTASAQVPHFHLHLSSEGISQISSGQLDDIHKIGAFKSNRESFPQLSVIQNEMDCAHNVENGDHSPNISSRECLPRISQRLPPVPPTRDNQIHGKKYQEKLDGHLETIDINDVVELAIAASEALVISELTTRGSHSEFLNTDALLEVALRVKQARNDCHVDVLEAVSSNISDELDETGLLHAMDDYIMADAFDDVGLPRDQIFMSPIDSFGSKVSTMKFQTNLHNSEQGHLPYTYDLYVPKTQLSEDHGCRVAQQNVERAQDLDFGAIGLQEKLSFSSTVGSRPKQLRLQALPLNHMEPSIHRPFNLDTSNIKDHTRESVNTFQNDCDGSASAKNLSKEDRYIQGDEDIIHRDRKLRRNVPNFFHGETSLISESVDVPTVGNAIVRTPVAEPKIIASSSSLFDDLHKVPYVENKIQSDEEVVASCNLLEIDTLCSVVPCSLSSDYTHVSDGHKQEAMGLGCSLKPAVELVGLQNPEDSVPIMVDAERSNFVASTLRNGGSTVTRTQLNSLKNYSDIAPAKCASSPGKRELIPTMTIAEEKYFMMSLREEETAGILVKPTTKCQSVNEQSRSWKTNIKSYRPSATADSISGFTEQILNHEVDGDIDPVTHQHADTSVPIILNTGARHRLQACNTISSKKYEDENPKISLLSATKKKKTRNYFNEVRCRNQTFVSGCLCSSLHRDFLEEENMPMKKVRFSEAEADVHYIPANLTEEQSLPAKKVWFSEADDDFCRKNVAQPMSSEHHTRFHAKTNRKIKGSSNSSKSGSRKSNCRYLTNDFSKNKKKQILRGLEFLLTGFSRKKKREIETLIGRCGGLVLPDIPSPYLSNGLY